MFVWWGRGGIKGLQINVSVKIVYACVLVCTENGWVGWYLLHVEHKRSSDPDTFSSMTDINKTLSGQVFEVQNFSVSMERSECIVQGNV